MEIDSDSIYLLILPTPSQVFLAGTVCASGFEGLKRLPLSTLLYRRNGMAMIQVIKILKKNIEW